MKARARRLYAACVLVLACGLASAGFVYFSADDAPAATATYIIINGKGYAVDPSSSKAYVRDLKRFGGSLAVLFDEFNRWFASLWQGRALAGTLLLASVFASALLLFLAWREDR